MSAAVMEKVGGAKAPLASGLGKGDDAKRLAQSGIAVFPCKADKKPLVKGWNAVATTDLGQIERWWQRFPEAIIGVPTGEKSGLYVVDLDVNKQDGQAIGEQSLKDKGVCIDRFTYCVRTPSGGFHIFFKWTDERNTGRRLPGVDTRGEGGYVICYDADTIISAHSDPDLERCPVGLIDSPATPEPRKPALARWPLASGGMDAGRGRAWGLSVMEAVCSGLAALAEGSRNTELNKAALRLYRIVLAGHLTVAEVEYELRAACMSNSLIGDDGDKAFEKTLESARNAADAAGPSEPPERDMDVGTTMATAAATVPMEAPQPLVRGIGDPAPFPMEALGPLRGAAEAAQDCTQCPPAIAAQSALAVVALAAQGLHDIETLHGHCVLSLFLLTVARSGERKSSTDKLLMKPIAEYEASLRGRYAEKEQSYKAAFAAWKSTHDEVLKTKQRGKGEEAPKTIEEIQMAKDADLHELGPEPTPPITPQLIAPDPTVEGLIKSMGLGQPSQGVFSDEGGAFIGGHGMSEENRLKTCAQLSKLWDGQPINRTRAGDGAVTYAGRRVSMHLMMQRVAAEGLLGDEVAREQGFLSRCLIAEPASTIGTRMHREPDPASKPALAEFGRRIKALLTTELPLKPDTQNELEPPVLPLTPEARALLIDFADDVERAQNPGGEYEGITGLASKSAEHVCRLAGVMAVYADEAAVSADLMGNAVALVRFYLGEAIRLCGVSVISGEIRRAEKVREWLAENGHVGRFVTRRMITRGPRCVRDTGDAKSAIKLLVEHGWLVTVNNVEVEGKLAKEAWQVRGAE